jgi:hypothetical protein
VIGEIACILWLGIPVRVPIHVYKRTVQPAIGITGKREVLYSLCVKLVKAVAVEPVFLFLLQPHTSPVSPPAKSSMY